MTTNNLRTLVYPKSHESEYFALGIDDDAGCGLSHTHDDFGHVFPMTQEELMELRQQIDEILKEKKRTAME